jgi:RNA polymerase sigma-70 factor (ECF subfamily)
VLEPGVGGGQHRCRTDDADSRRWLVQLRSDGAVRDDALRRLHTLLLKMAYTRLRPRGARVPPDAVDELALEAANDALVAVLGHLDSFRGASRFTTWACQFAITEVSVTMRRYRRQRRELPVEPDVVVRLAGARESVEHDVEQAELVRRVCIAIGDALTERQRHVLLAFGVAGDSPQELAASLKTNVGALYKTLHDARRKLRAQLASQGLSPLGESLHVRDKNSRQSGSYAVGTVGAAP